MPCRRWKHVCPDDNATVWQGVPVCATCGQAGQYGGWHYSMIEAMAAYQHRTGLRPVGTHRPLADELLTPHSQPCPACQGKGILDSADGASYRACAACHGDGRVWTCSKDELARLLRLITEKFPDAAIGDEEVGIWWGDNRK